MTTLMIVLRPVFTFSSSPPAVKIWKPAQRQYATAIIVTNPRNDLITFKIASTPVPDPP